MSTRAIASGGVHPYYFGVTWPDRDREYVVFLVYRTSMKDYVGQLLVKHLAANRLERSVVNIKAEIVQQAGGSWISHAIKSAYHTQQLLSRAHPVMSLSQGEQTFPRSARRALFEASIVEHLRNRPCPGSDNEIPTCFICFNVDEGDVGDFLREKLVVDLKLAGFNVHFCFDGLNYSDDLYRFMDQAYSSDKVVVVCTPALQDKVNARVKGVSYEVDKIVGARIDRDGPDTRDVFPLYYSGSREESAPKPWFLTCFAAKLLTDRDDGWEDNYFETAFKFIAALKGMSRSDAGAIIELWRQDLQHLPTRLSDDHVLKPGEKLAPLLSEEHMNNVIAWYETTTFKTFEAVHLERTFNSLVKENVNNPGLIEKASELRLAMRAFLQESVENLSYNERLLHELWTCKHRLEESLELVSKNSELVAVLTEVYYFTLEGIWLLCWIDPGAEQPKHGEEQKAVERLADRLLKQLPKQAKNSIETEFYLNCCKQAARCFEIEDDCWEMYQTQVQDKRDVTQIANFLKQSHADIGIEAWYTKVCLLLHLPDKSSIFKEEVHHPFSIIGIAIECMQILNSNQAAPLLKDKALECLGKLVLTGYEEWKMWLEHLSTSPSRFVWNRFEGIDNYRKSREFVRKCLFEIVGQEGQNVYARRSCILLHDIIREKLTVSEDFSREDFVAVKETFRQVMEPSCYRALVSFLEEKFNNSLVVAISWSSMTSGVIGLIGVAGLTLLSETFGLMGLFGLTGLFWLFGVKGITHFHKLVGMGEFNERSKVPAKIILLQMGLSGLVGLGGAIGPLSQIMGLVGLSGVSGLIGLFGLTGLQLVIGLNGLSRLIGETGLIGLTGLMGLSGLIGLSSLTGVKIDPRNYQYFAGLMFFYNSLFWMSLITNVLKAMPFLVQARHAMRSVEERIIRDKGCKSLIPLVGAVALYNVYLALQKSHDLNKEMFAKCCEPGAPFDSSCNPDYFSFSSNLDAICPSELPISSFDPSRLSSVVEHCRHVLEHCRLELKMDMDLVEEALNAIEKKKQTPSLRGAKIQIQTEAEAYNAKKKRKSQKVNFKEVPRLKGP
ncbi:hypothetical protein COB21_01055 [Candidatus Aerophobetes bacterium]|uniref:TIR domain-containing protein n=1 Tax=Aerophobetes bacterium TaxID=2030807 RepID=A0A2A4X6I4_UNCAE|nr:MAG: hypothetical protein COB21_01055 [Candidatus Aerophobetes bacterium]